MVLPVVVVRGRGGDTGEHMSSPTDGRARTISAGARQAALPPLVAIIGTIAVLYFGRDVFLPLAIALLLTFALAPVSTRLRKLGIPRVPAVLVTVMLAFIGIGLFTSVAAVQIGELAQNIPTYQSNVLVKIRGLKETGAGGGLLEQITGAIERVGEEIKEEAKAATAPAEEPESDPLPVTIVSQPGPIEILQNLIAPLLSPLASVGLVIIVVIFMLLEREDLRDRFIRLVGSGDLHRTTEALQDAGKRVAQYLLMQLVVNVSYAIPIGAGLWLLGIPNALLWALLTLVLRFVPYIGPIIAAFFPLALAIAVDPGWETLIWTAALLIVIELISNNVVEPWLYGSRTGLSPLAIIVAAIFWTWLWGPVGLVMSTPLTVCLVVLGRHVPQFEFLDVLFGNEPVLEPHARLYQRLLAGDPDEATDHAEEMLEEKYLVEFYQEVAIPALRLAEIDRVRGVLGEQQRRALAASTAALVSNLDAIAREELEEEEQEVEEKARGDGQAPEEATPGRLVLPDGVGKTVVCAGGRGELDDAAAAMLAQVLRVQGATASTISFKELGPAGLRSLELDGIDSFVVGFLNRNSVRQARFLVRRAKRLFPDLRVGVVFWSGAPDNEDAERLGSELGADFAASDLAGVITGALSDAPVARLTTRKRPLVRGFGSAGEGTAPSEA